MNSPQPQSFTRNRRRISGKREWCVASGAHACIGSECFCGSMPGRYSRAVPCLQELERLLFEHDTLVEEGKPQSFVDVAVQAIKDQEAKLEAVTKTGREMAEKLQIVSFPWPAPHRSSALF